MELGDLLDGLLRCSGKRIPTMLFIVAASRSVDEAKEEIFAEIDLVS